MIRVEKGNVYSAFRFRSGVSERGRWEIIMVRETGPSKQEMTIVPAEVPSGVAEGGQFKIKEIHRVDRKKKKDAEGKWTLTDVCITASIEPMKVGEVNLDGDLPFDLDAYGDDDDVLIDDGLPFKL